MNEGQNLDVPKEVDDRDDEVCGDMSELTGFTREMSAEVMWWQSVVPK